LEFRDEGLKLHFECLQTLEIMILYEIHYYLSKVAIALAIDIETGRLLRQHIKAAELVKEE
jgi:hypothetical protein